MSSIYLVSSGSYSDYSIEGVFSTEQLAQEYLDLINDSYGDARIEEYKLDDLVNKSKVGLKLYKTMMKEDGEVYRGPYIQHPSYGESTSFYPIYPRKISINSHKDRGADNSKDPLEIYLMTRAWAKDEKHAIKITNERRVHLKAENMYPKLEDYNNYEFMNNLYEKINSVYKEG